MTSLGWMTNDADVASASWSEDWLHVGVERDRVLDLFGKWKDARSEAEIVTDIEGARSFGREVSL